MCVPVYGDTIVHNIALAKGIRDALLLSECESPTSDAYKEKIQQRMAQLHCCSLNIKNRPAKDHLIGQTHENQIMAEH